jgi:perosamine synthetase
MYKGLKLHFKVIFKRKIFFNFNQNGPSVATVWRARKNLRDLGCKQIVEYEEVFAKLIGDGSAVSFASGRMAFSMYLELSGIGSGDEVIIPGFTCSVMVNAIFRSGAKPVYCDVDRKNYGTLSENIETLITPKTKLIIAQHSFGNACDVQAIVFIADKYKILVLEDCALTLGTRVKGNHVGNFGSAAIFSTDHSKPINTFIGGILYSKNKELIDKVKQLRESIPPLTLKKRQSIFWYFLLERSLANPKLNRFWPFTQLIFLKYLHFMRRPSPFLNNDNSPQINTGDYKYPSKFPEFLAYIGIQEITRWPENLKVRRKHEIEIISVLQSKFGLSIPKAKDSTGLRVVFLDKENSVIAKRVSAFVDLESVWFKKPIINTNSRMEEFGYTPGTAKNAEFVGDRIMNIPILDSPLHHSMLLKMLMRNPNQDRFEM